MLFIACLANVILLLIFVAGELELSDGLVTFCVRRPVESSSNT
jgi:hypothetical protein